MGGAIRKLGRTAQVHVPFLRDLGKSGEAWLRRILRSPHDADFAGLRLIARPDHPLCLDIGANRGAAARSIRTLWPDAEVVCFEPLPSLAGELQRRAGFPVKVHDLALGDSAGEFTLHVPVYNGLEFDGLASLEPEAARSWLNPDTLYGFRSDRLQLREAVCAVQPLDVFGYAPFFIKIDVQGHELAVIRGGLRTILANEPIILAENDSLDLEAVLALLAPAGYSCLLYRRGRWFEGQTAGANLYLAPRSKRTLFKGLAAHG